MIGLFALFAILQGCTFSIAELMLLLPEPVLEVQSLPVT
jgi:hypothetical protein